MHAALDRADLSHIGCRSQPGLVESMGIEFWEVLNLYVCEGLRHQTLGLVSCVLIFKYHGDTRIQYHSE